MPSYADMELRQLESFLAIAEEGTMTAAARRCHLTQPAISQQLKLLEDELGERLFHRMTRGMELTAAGQIVYDSALRLRQESQSLVQALALHRGIETEVLTIGMIPTVAPFVLPPLLPALRRAHPRLKIQIVEEKTSRLLELVVAGEVDFAILSDIRPQDCKKWALELENLCSEPLWLAMPRNHELANTPCVSLQQLAQQTLIHLKDGHCLGAQTKSLCQIDQFHISVECDQMATAIAMVAAEMGLTIVPAMALQSLRRDDVIYKIFSPPAPERKIQALMRRNKVMDPASLQLLEELRAHLQVTSVI